MKRLILMTSSVILAVSALLVAGCAREELPDNRDMDYGYVQFKLYKEVSYGSVTKAAGDYLLDEILQCRFLCCCDAYFAFRSEYRYDEYIRIRNQVRRPVCSLWTRHGSSTCDKALWKHLDNNRNNRRHLLAAAFRR